MSTYSLLTVFSAQTLDVVPVHWVSSQLTDSAALVLTQCCFLPHTEIAVFTSLQSLGLLEFRNSHSVPTLVAGGHSQLQVSVYLQRFTYRHKLTLDFARVPHRLTHNQAIKARRCVAANYSKV